MRQQKSAHLLSRSILAVCFLLLAAPAAAQKWGKITEDEWNMPPPEDCPEAAAVVLFDKGELRVSLGEIELSRHVRIKVFNKAGMGNAAEVEIPYVSDDRIRELKAQTVMPDGSNIEVKGKEIFEKTAGPYKIKTFTFPAVQDGVILEYRYKNRNERYHFIDPWDFQSELYTVRSEFSLILHRGFSYRFLAKNLPEGQSQPVAEDYHDMQARVSEFTWTLHDLPPVKEEPMMGSRNDYRRVLYCQLSTYHDPDYHYTYSADWAELGEMLHYFVFDEYVNGEKQIRELADSLCAGATTRDEQAKVLYDYVCTSIETRGTRSNWFWNAEHDRLEDVLKKGYGTAVEKNVLLIELLRARGFEAFPLLIGTRDFGSFNPSVIQLSQFNHTICYLTGSGLSYALDTGENGIPFPYLPPDDLVSGGLRVDKKNSTAVSLPVRPRKSGRTIASTLVLGRDGSARCSTHVVLQGYTMAALAEAVQNGSTSDDMIEALFPDLPADHEIAAFTTEPDTAADCLYADCVLEFPELCREIEANLFVPPVFSAPFANPFTADRRFCPVDFQYPCKTQYDLDIIFPAGARMAAVPDDVEQGIAGVQWSRAVLPRTGSVEIVSSMTITDPVVLPDQYLSIQNIFSTMVEKGAEPLALTLGD